MNESTPNKSSPEDGEPTSFAETAKILYKKHRTKILAVGAVSLAVVGVVASLAEGQVDGETKDFGPVPDLEVADRQKPSSPSAPFDVAASLVKLNGRRASDKAKANYKRDTGEDLPPDRTYRPRHSKNVSAERTPA
ncbi:hypothetical protein [Streptomyces virginiae]|uniref:hypothetical protein n=1 Tax=Streptomyces virginiae TaxID=1961 RepID=UPI0032542057